jgi:hypothetical protein
VWIQTGTAVFTTSYEQTPLQFTKNIIKAIEQYAVSFFQNQQLLNATAKPLNAPVKALKHHCKNNSKKTH